MVKKIDKIIIGAGLYGLYAAEYSSNKGEEVLVLEYDREPFSRATYINQARVHMGYHYPRSLTTAIKSAGYFKRFVDDFDFCIHDKFEQIYATSDQFSWTNAKQFIDFCKAADIRCDEVAPSRYFKNGMCDGAFLTEEYTYDAKILGAYYLEKLEIREAKDGLVPDSVFFLLDMERNILLGAVNIRHYLNDYLLQYGGHIGDGIRPSERGKGYATEMIRLALIECKRLGIDKVLMVCD